MDPQVALVGILEAIRDKNRLDAVIILNYCSTGFVRVGISPNLMKLYNLLRMTDNSELTMTFENRIGDFFRISLKTNFYRGKNAR